MATKRKYEEEGVSTDSSDSDRPQNKGKKHGSQSIVIRKTTTILGKSHTRIPSFIMTFCNPGKVVELCHELKGKKAIQLSEVESIGFSGLLDIKLTKFNRDMVPFLVDCFDGNGLMFVTNDGKSKFLVTDLDCRDVFLLPCTKVSVPESTDVEYTKDLKNKLGLADVDTCAMLKQILVSLEDGDCRFIPMFVLYVCSVLLAPKPNKQVDYKISKALLDRDMIGNYNWCGFLLNRLCAAINSFKAKKTKKEEPKSVTGCILLLEILYLHRFNFRGEKAPTGLPLIKHWTNSKIVERIKLEKKSRFGNAFMDLNTYPISKMRDDDNLRIEMGKEVANGAKEAVRTAGNEDSRVIQYIIPPGLHTNKEIHENAGGNDFLEAVLLCKRDLELISSINISRLAALKNNAQSTSINMSQLGTLKNNDQTTSTKESSPTMSQIEYTDKDLELIDSTVEQFLKVHSLMESMPIFDTSIPTEKDHSTASYDVNPNVLEEMENEPIEEPAINSIPIFDTSIPGEKHKSISSYEVIQNVLKKLEKEQIEEPRIELPDFILDNTFDVKADIFSHPSDLQKSIDIDLVSIFCNFDCGSKDNVDVQFVSDYMVKNKDKMRLFSYKQQEVLDYAFFEDEKRTLSEKLFLGAKLNLITREDFLSLQAGVLIDGRIIDSWCELLNNFVKRNEDHTKDSRFYFGLSHMWSFKLCIQQDFAHGAEETVLKVLKEYIHSNYLLNYFLMAEMIFIPLCLEKHYFGVVINLKLDKIQVIDNRKYPMQSKFTNWAVSLAEIAGRLLEMFNHPLQKDVGSFESEILGFDWQTNYATTKNVDCGVFVMMSFLLFKGQIFESDLRKPVRRRLYRASIGVALLLDDMNTVRNSLLESVDKFKKEKHQILEGAAEKENEEMQKKIWSMRNKKKKVTFKLSTQE